MDKTTDKLMQSTAETKQISRFSRRGRKSQCKGKFLADWMDIGTRPSGGRYSCLSYDKPEASQWCEGHAHGHYGLLHGVGGWAGGCDPEIRSGMEKYKA